MQQNFIQNLRLLCSYYPSISEVSRRLGLNRQQLMKYLGGMAFPSAHSMRRICDFFGVEEYEIVMPNEQFRDILRVKPSIPVSRELAPPVVSSLLKLAARQYSELQRYASYYYEFRYSFTTPGMILKSLICIFQDESMMFYKSIERLRRRTPSRGGSDVFKYRGILLQLGNRLHLLDYEDVMGEEMSHMILFPPYRSRISTLFGMKMGVTATEAHEPIAARVVLQNIGRRGEVRKMLKLCGLYEPDADEIPATVQAYLGTNTDDDGNILRASAEVNKASGSR